MLRNRLSSDAVGNCWPTITCPVCGAAMKIVLTKIAKPPAKQVHLPYMSEHGEIVM
ncbi:conserved hypothetical protein [delta proteobacterium NaphS2]|nr:conserved hypothetical protein [delta proteobacterium NaphS2]